MHDLTGLAVQAGRGRVVGELAHQRAQLAIGGQAARVKSTTPRPSSATVQHVSHALTLTAVFTPDEDGWTMAQLAEWPAVVTCGRTVEEARETLPAR